MSDRMVENFSLSQSNYFQAVSWINTSLGSIKCVSTRRSPAGMSQTFYPIRTGVFGERANLGRRYFSFVCDLRVLTSGKQLKIGKIYHIFLLTGLCICTGFRFARIDTQAS